MKSGSRPLSGGTAGEDQEGPAPGPGNPETGLVEGLKKGRQAACNQLVKEYQGRLLKLVYGITLDMEDSREIVQDVFVKAIRNIRGFRQESRLWGWIRKIAVNECLNWKRRWKRRFRWHHRSLEPDQESGFPDESGTRPDPESSLREKQAQDRLMKAVARLSQPLRVVFVLKAFEDLSYEEIGRSLNISRGTVSSRLYHARKQIMEAMEK
ncbi:RNA polymerase sigma factor [Desulfospira joergensenii]|uniref:RNA polymerase sigma factor n=1 Tax=Desulfospira joergensenii TaxID=53329 RepID=UPI0003B4D70B|nr:RNA polymerase sigma factor [Desulfospira joergensenii]